MPTIDANRLRWLAEAADGTRDEPMCLVTDESAVEVVKKADVGKKRVLLDLVTKTRGDGITDDVKVRLKWKGRVYGGKELDDADALFVSQSAVDKFLLPYYMRFKSGAQVQSLENKLFNDPTVVAAFHIPPSYPHGFPPKTSSLPCGVVRPVENSEDFTAEMLMLEEPR